VVIETEREFESMVAQLERLDFPARTLAPEERALQELLSKLVEDYDSRKHPLPSLAPRKLLLFLMEQRELRQRDLIPVFGSSSVVSSVLNGKREISKAHARKLAGFFGLSTDLFI
jgi:HTH-type transcriptional regulator / antitoxin HigA